MSADRTAALVAVAASTLLVPVAAMDWFGFPGTGGGTMVSGVSATGALWVVPALGVSGLVLSVLAGRVVRAGGRASRQGGWLAAIGALALGWTGWAAAAAPVRLSAVIDGRRVTLPVEPDRLAPAVVAPAAAALVLAAGLVMALPRVRWPR